MTALISGASRGIGAACARALRVEGHRVVINYNKNRKPAEDLALELAGLAVMADVSDPRAVKDMFALAGDVDILVVNAGIAMQKLFTDTTYEDWRRVFAVNVDGAYNLIAAALPHMIHEKYGRIVIVSSMWGLRGASCEVAYSASKAAVNCVCPGVIDTDMNSGLTPDALSSLIDDTPLCRLGAPDDVAHAVAFLCSDKASFITGQTLPIDGGFST